MRVRAHKNPLRRTYPVIDGRRAPKRAPRFRTIAYRLAIGLAIAIVVGAILYAIATMPAGAFFSAQCGETGPC